MTMRFLNIGYGNIVSAHRIIAIVSPESAPIKRLVQEGREQNILLDATYGRKTRAVIIMDDGHIVLSPIQPETIAQRLNGNAYSKDDLKEENEG
ncbi:DUF370 domain-containing protein [Ectobacillus antri]|jgi:regulator of extracellular matrix RemA (YlzA/DUF370 family)|uniref:Putative regulatory protein P6P90_00880 n=1 Tax=Ectobacillus antri TaxID=2486280 RepID=A0ABT6H182_9BACI|nr:DUF370 domain-containing protein [Ectobacillus antri]MDG4655878.1 DUF370 domain-containing protein [Ectobacillus antri]MDG5752553.1 DUF370 domain-containing protein [Ectobacillus antri]